MKTPQRATRWQRLNTTVDRWQGLFWGCVLAAGFAAICVAYLKLPDPRIPASSNCASCGAGIERLKGVKVNGLHYCQQCFADLADRIQSDTETDAAGDEPTGINGTPEREIEF